VSDLEAIHYTRTVSDDGKGMFKYIGSQLTKECFLTHYYPRVCPQCLAEHGIAMAIWDLTLFVACPKHACLLIDTCPACATRISWKRSKIAICRCGFRLADAPAPPANDFELAFAHSLWYQFDLEMVPNTNYGKWSTYFRRFAGMSFDAQLKAVWFLGRLLPSSTTLTKGHGRAKLGLTDSIQILRSAGDILSDWPKSLDTLALAALSNAPMRKGPKRIATLLGPTYRFLIEELDGQEFKFISNAFESSLERAFASNTQLGQISQSRKKQLEFNFSE
jgi:hypothetical protein